MMLEAIDNGLRISFGRVMNSKKAIKRLMAFINEGRLIASKQMS